MPVSSSPIQRDAAKAAILKARRLAGMLQGTMGLEGQGLDKKALRDIRKQMTKRLLGMG